MRDNEETFVPGTPGAEGESEAPAVVRRSNELDPTRQEEAEKLLQLMLRYSSATDGSFGFLLHELSSSPQAARRTMRALPARRRSRPYTRASSR